jgi:DNA-binding NarL/FixJ family response regulator
VIQRLRKRHPSARIALITASEGARYEEEARAAGADVTISTAYPESFVTEKILKLLENWKNT